MPPNAAAAPPVTKDGKVMIGKYSEGHLLKRAKEIVETKSKKTKIFNENAEARIPRFDTGELDLGRVLGRGGFCVVSEVTKVKLNKSSTESKQPVEQSEEDEHHIINIVQDRNFMEKHCLRNNKDARYAVKILRADCTKDPQTFINGIVDLALEAKFLAVIRHPNIIKMRALSDSTPYSRNYFVVLDRLYDILHKRLLTWRKKQVGGLRAIMDRKGKKKTEFWVERLTVAYDLATALRHLHELNVVYRDLKPDNIGFDVRGDVKIFDFGLAREIDRSKMLKDGTYQLTGETGSPRYMSPEVALEKPYNDTADVYSFSVLLWEICQLETPYEGFNLNLFKNKVVRGGARPKPNPKWPPEIIRLMKNGWSPKISARPSMAQVCTVLREEIESQSNESVNEILDASNKSAMSLHAFGNK